MSAYNTAMTLWTTDSGLSVEEAQKLYDSIAHDLAEKIRNSCPCYVDPDSGCGDAECVGKMDAADLIDPDVRG